MLLRSVTVSLGVACWDGSMSPQELLRQADEALYRAKGEGRDRAVLAQAQTV
jgi:diguanylate cyclase (GGDEF)-like protein